MVFECALICVMEIAMEYSIVSIFDVKHVGEGG